MRPLRDLPTIRRLNAPTRAAAARRRRIRKATSAGMVALAAVIALAPNESGSGSSREVSQADAHLNGRHLMSLPAAAALVSSLNPASRIDVWDGRGKLLARGAPVVPPRHNARESLSANGQGNLLVALTEEEIRRVSLSRNGSASDAPNMTLTISP